MRFAAGLALVMLGTALASDGRAAEPPPHPVLRIDAPMHAGMVRRLAVDWPRKRLVTAGDDKTIRIWRLPKGGLERVLRVPIDAGHEGKVFALAVSPDGRIVAAGGWTGWEWDQQASLYLFDSDTGEMIRRVAGFPEAIGAAGFSPDGRFLAVGLQSTGGLRLLRTTDYASVAGDSEYGDKVMALDYAADGRLAVVALDGYLRLYDPQGRLVARVRAGPGRMPSAARFSPDGREIAIGHVDVPAIAVVDAQDLRLVAVPSRHGLKATTELSDLAWTADGALYTCGAAAEGGGYIFRWTDRGRGGASEWRVADQRITDLRALPDGGIAFAAEDPAVGILARDGATPLAIRANLADFRGAGDAFRVSSDGARVRFSYDAAQRHQVQFSLRAREIRRVTRADDDLRPATLASSRFVLDLPKDGGPLVVNGVGARLMDYELVRSHAFAPDGATLAVGTDWNVRAFGPDGAERWKTATSGIAWNVAVTGDGRTVVATLSDGTIRWYRIEDGTEYLALFFHPASEEWIAWTPAGYYVSSSHGDDLVGWHLNRGKDHAADFFRAAQFERILYRPDLVDAALRGRGAAVGAASAVRGVRFDIARLDAIAPPALRVAASAAGGSGGRVTLRIDAWQRALPMEDLSVFVNNVPVLAGPSRLLAGPDRTGFVRELVVDLPERENLVRVEVGSGVSLGLAEAYVDRPDAPAAPVRRPGRLHVLAVGVDAFPGLVGADLAYAARDAAEVVRVISEQGREHFTSIRANVVSDLSGGKPDRAQILSALAEFARDATAEDTVVLFLASHGLSDQAGNYYFVPRDAQQEDVDAVRRGPGGDAHSLIGWRAFFDALRGTAGRRLLVVDTCEARGIEGRLDLHSLSKRSASSRFALLVASQADEDSQEYPPARHGLFTHALLGGLEGASDTDGDGRVTLQEVFEYVVSLVERLRDPSIGPQTPQLLAPEPLGGTVLARGRPARTSAGR